jgi:hypothetical protein
MTTATGSRPCDTLSGLERNSRNSVGAALDNNATFTSLDLSNNNIGAQGARSLAAALDTNHMLQHLHLNGISIAADIKNLVADRLGVNQLALNVPAWVAYAVARLTAVPGHLGVPPSFAECAAMLAFKFGDELLCRSGARRAGASSRRPICCRWPRLRCARAAAAGRRGC